MAPNDLPRASRYAWLVGAYGVWLFHIPQVLVESLIWWWSMRPRWSQQGHTTMNSWIVAQARLAVKNGAAHDCDEWQSADGRCALCGRTKP